MSTAELSIAPAATESKLDFRFGWLPMLFAAQFFLPYVMGSRLRVEVAMGYLAIVLLPWAVLPHVRAMRVMFWLSFLMAAWLGLRIVISPSSQLEENAVLWTNHSFFLMSMAVLLALRDWVPRNIDRIIYAVLLISVGINLVAVFQWVSPNHALNTKLFELYGGELNSGYSGEFASNAAFLVQAAKRYTSIFNGMHSLGLFDAIVISITLASLTHGTFERRKKLLMLGILSLAFFGGMLSASKTFYGGVVFALAPYLTIGRHKIILITILIVLAGGVMFIRPMLDDASAANRVFAFMLEMDVQRILASRFSSGDGYLAATIDNILSSPKCLAIGNGGQLAGYTLADSGFLPPIILGGLPLLLLNLVAVGALILLNWCSYRQKDEWGLCFVSIHLAMLAVAIGIPTYQLGRLSQLVLTLNFATLLRHHLRYQAARRETPAAPWDHNTRLPLRRAA